MDDYVNGTIRAVEYDYDRLQRLTQETIGSASIRYDGLTPVGGSGASMLGYDSVGNRQSRRSTVSPTIVIATPNNIPYDVNDRADNDTVQTTHSTRFDLNGNTLKADLNGNGVIDASEDAYSYTYDLDDRLVTSNGDGKSITLSYDSDGNRVNK